MVRTDLIDKQFFVECSALYGIPHGVHIQQIAFEEPLK